MERPDGKAGTRNRSDCLKRRGKNRDGQRNGLRYAQKNCLRNGRAGVCLLVFLMLSVPAAALMPAGGLVAEAEESTETETAGASLSEEEKKLLEETARLLEEGNPGSEEEIRDALNEAEERLGIALTDAQKEKLSSLLEKVSGSGTGSEEILDKVESLYETYGEELVEDTLREKLVEPVQEAAAEKTESVLKEFFRTMGETIQEFFSNLFS